jgi:UDP-GlcNAc:undecaprenyl-phosphate GlcNAc-1-phosphate transferase
VVLKVQLSPAIFGFSLACLLALLLTPVIRRLAAALRLRDRPGPRKIHRSGRAHLGGLGIVAAFSVASLTTARLFEGRPPNLGSLSAVIVPLGIWICVIGLLDDLRGLRPALRLGAQLLAIGILQFSLDLLGLERLSVYGLPGQAAALFLAVPWILGLTNGMNLIDGLDGLASGIAVCSGLGLTALGLAVGAPAAAAIAAVVVGASLGFLRSNAHPAKIFMGDSGSTFLGFVLATIGAAIFWARPAMSTLVALVFISWVPCLDTAYAVLRRWRGRTGIFRGDEGHIHHRLLGAGLSQRVAGAGLWGLSSLAAIAGVQIALGHRASAWALLVGLATLPLLWFLRPSATAEPARLAPSKQAAPSGTILRQDRAA